MTYVLALYGALVAALTFVEWRQTTRAQYILKPLCALTFVLIAILSGALSSNYGVLILVALIFCALGDVALLLRDKPKLFLLGMGGFALGHALYVAAFAGQELRMSGLLSGLGLGGTFAALFILFLWKDVPRDMRLAVIGYTIIIALMLGTAAGFAFAKDIWIIYLAAIMFAASDFVVARDRFKTRAAWHPFVITPLYFGAQALFALSVASVL
ncbi:lysoplasmalogenase family protein [Fretibacter rubidus]|uniref:lysoplasmalogenase family protein n=1 Tax=Fretibacter rubidus TaxID=570162 RepID=UPI003529E1FE